MNAHTKGGPLKGGIPEIHFHAGPKRVGDFYRLMGSPKLLARKGLHRHPVWRVWAPQSGSTPVTVAVSFCGHTLRMGLHSGMLLMLPGVAGYPMNQLQHPKGIIIDRTRASHYLVGGQQALKTPHTPILYDILGNPLNEEDIRGFHPAEDTPLMWGYNMPP